MAAVICGVRHEMRRIYLFLPSSSSSTTFQYFLHPKASFHSLSSSFYLCLHPKPSKSSPSSTLSLSSYPSTHPYLLYSHSCHLTPLSCHQSRLLTSASLSSLSFPSITLHAALFSTSPLTHKTRTKVEGGPPEGKKQRPDRSEMITLIDTEDKVSAVSLDNAERLAKRRDLKLVKVDDPNMRAGKKVYKLMTGKQYFEEEIKAKKAEKKTGVGGKDEKILVIGGKITSHDLGIKLHSLTKWLSKGHQIKVTITSRKATQEDMDNVFSAIEEGVKEVKARVMQRHEKGNDIRFYIAPAKDGSAASSKANTDDHVHSKGSEESPGHAKGGV